MPRFDPYEEIGVDKDATPEEIKKAARAAHKRNHPDAGGDVDAFSRSRRAELVLLDPVKRKKFDDTGTVDDNRPDNARSGALQIIENFIGPVIGEYINSNFAVEKDPRRRDLLEEFCAKINSEIDGLAGQIPQMKTAIAFLKDMIDRFETDDPVAPIERGLQRQIDGIEASIEANLRGIEMRKLAIEIASKYRFRVDPFFGIDFGIGDRSAIFRTPWR